jgi:succinate dehydrogenase / fumarate reductase, cytochrome b subunit
VYTVSKERRMQAYAELWPSQPRWGLWAWWVQRVTGVALVGYVVWHVVTISRAARHPEAFAALLRILTHPAVFVVLLLGLAYHTANGIRVVLIDLGVEGMRGRRAFWVLVWLALLAALAGILRGVFRIL